MKKTLLTIAVAALTVASFAQGTLNVGNYFSGQFGAPIYGPEPADSHYSLSGQSSLGVPSGTTVYTGPLLQGANFTFAVYAGPAGATDPNLLTLLTTAPFRTAAGNVLPAGLIFPQTVGIPGVLPGGTAALQVRVWYNPGGALSWNSASTRGASSIFSSLPLGGITLLGDIVITPDMTGWASFNITGAPIPEPRAFVLAGLGAVALLLFRRRK
jgi:hypothetical protein